MNILVVDDETISCDGIRKRLEKMGIPEISEVFTAYNPFDALKILQHEKIDILISDIQMDGMTGLQLIENAQMTQPTICCVILSAYADFEYAQQAIRLGVVDFLVKPCSEEKTHQTVMRAIEKAKGNHSETENREWVKQNRPIQWACQYVREMPLEKIDMAIVANELNMSYHYFSKLFKREMGVLFSSFVMDVKMKQALDYLRAGMKVQDVAQKVGYQNLANFTRAFKRYYQETPSVHLASRQGKNDD